MALVFLPICELHGIVGAFQGWAVYENDFYILLVGDLFFLEREVAGSRDVLPCPHERYGVVGSEASSLVLALKSRFSTLVRLSRLYVSTFEAKMIGPSLIVLTWTAAVLQQVMVMAAPTWPSSIDEVEDLMLLNTGYRARGFADPVTPCASPANGARRITAAEFIRTAFHDMASGNAVTQTGGLDGSIIFEATNSENVGSAFISTVNTLAPFFTARSSMADIIALSLVTAVRSCGGPAVPMRAGRIDATRAGPTGFVPLPGNLAPTFRNQFGRMGFSPTQMIQVVACGHTLGGVHAQNFPGIVPPGSTPNDFKHFDSTIAFDEKVAAEYVANTTTDPLVVGPAVENQRSDLIVFRSDGNVTIRTMADPATFRSTCRVMLQKMIDLVPGGVVLTTPIAPYDVKPNGMQLTLLDGGSQISFTGEIRVRTTTRAASQIDSVQLVYKDRTGGNGCGGCTFGTTVKGTAAGFDDSFTVSTSC